MSTRSILCLAVLLCAALPAVASARDRCHHTGDRTVALTKQMRVYQDGESGYYVGCLRSTGRTTTLWEQDDIYVNGNVRAAAGRFVAYSWFATPACKADCPPGVTSTNATEVTDVRTGRTHRLSDDYRVPTVLLRSTGAVAWVTDWAPDAVLHLWRPGSATRTLASGDVHDVQAHGATLTWTDPEGHHSAPFR